MKRPADSRSPKAPGGSPLDITPPCESFRTLVESMAQGASLLTSDGLVLYTNPALCELLDRPAGELVGRPFAEVVAPESLPSWAVLIAPDLDTTRHGELLCLRHDGDLLPVAVSLVALLPSARIEGREVPLALLVTDLSEQRARETQWQRLLVEHEAQGEPRSSRLATALAEVTASRRAALNMMEDAVMARDASDRLAAELRASEGFVRAAMDALALNLCVLDGEGVIVATNQAWQRFAEANLPLPKHFGLGANYLAVCDAVVGAEAAEAARAAAGIRDVMSGARDDFVMEYACHSPAEQRWFAMRVRRFADFDPLRVVIVHDDITARVLSDLKRQELEGQLRQQQKLESIGTLAAGVAHEINNPIMGVMNYAQLIADELPQGGAVADYAGEILVETQRIATIVRNLLQFARQDRQAHSPARLSDIVAATLSLMRTVLRHDGIQLVIDVPDSLPQVRCRSHQLQQVVMNLVTNARDAANERLAGEHPDKTIHVLGRALSTVEGSWLRLTVTDPGPGMPAEVAARAMDPFYTTKPRDRGTGLGLSISHGIVQEHGGRLWFETTLGHGTRFHVDLPVERT